MDKYKRYEEKKHIREGAENWNNLPKGDKYTNSKFDISVAHCEIKLTRCGQQSHGGKNYWETNKEFGQKIAEVIKEDSTIIDRAIAKLKKDEDNSLADCKRQVTDILNKINGLNPTL